MQSDTGTMILRGENKVLAVRRWCDDTERKTKVLAVRHWYNDIEREE